MTCFLYARLHWGESMFWGVTFNDEKQVNPRVECIPECGDIYKV
jgi:hypothetical protein